MFCHYNASVVARFLTIAQDRGMMNGDYAFLTYADYATEAVLKPWWIFSQSELEHRSKSLYAVNLVRFG